MPNQEYAVGWFTLALLTAGVAQGKNRSGVNWFFLTIFLGPLATFILVAFCAKLPEPNPIEPIDPDATLMRRLLEQRRKAGA